MPIRLIAFDLDGTIVPDFHTIAPRVQAALRAAQERGVVVTLATGREYGVLKKFITLLNLRAPIICLQGALTVDPLTDATVSGSFMDSATARRVVEMARAQRLALYLYPGERAYAESASPLSRAMFAATQSPVQEVANLMDVLEPPPFKALIVEEAERVPGLMAEWQAALTDLPVDVTRSLETLIEIVPQGVSKGRALADLAARLGIAREDVMAVGDQDNDVEMLAWAGIGVAMGNASPKARAAADHLAPSIEEDGAAWAVERFVLGLDKHWSA